MNFEVCKQLVAYARKIEKQHNKNFRFTLTTNGIGITDEVIEWANKECYNVVLSLDGRKEVNDRFRKDLAGNGSYDRIVPKFQKLVKARGGKGYYMRGTFTHYNVDFTNDLFHMADDLGFTELSMEPVVTAPGSPEALTEEDLPRLYDQYELLAKDMLRREKAGQTDHVLPLYPGPCARPCVYKRISGCGSGHRIYGRDAVGRPVPLPPVCRRCGVQARQRVGRRDQHRPARRVQAVQRLRPARLQGLLGPALLRGRLRGQRPARDRGHPRRVRVRLQGVPQAHRVRADDQGG